MTTNDTTSQIHKALSGFATRPAGYTLLGRGDLSGVIVSDIARRTLWTYDINQPPVPLPLVESIFITPFVGIRPELEGVRVRIGYPPEEPNVLHIIGFDQKQGLTSVGGLMPSEQMLAAQKYVDTGSLINFRLAPNDPVDSEVYINPGWYLNTSGEPVWWGGGSSGDVTTLLETAIAALSAGNHQMAVVYIDAATNAPGILTNTEEAGGVNDKQLFDTTTVEEMTWTDGLMPCGAVHLYYGQTTVTEDDIYRDSDPRNIFNTTGSGGGGMTDFDVAADSGTPATIGNGDTLTLAGGTGLSSAIAGNTVTVNLDNTAVTPGSYTYTALTVDAQGRLTAASSGAAPITSPLTTKGDLWGYDTASARVPVGADGTELIADSLDAQGVSYNVRDIICGVRVEAGGTSAGYMTHSSFVGTSTAICLSPWTSQRVTLYDGTLWRNYDTGAPGSTVQYLITATQTGTTTNTSTTVTGLTDTTQLAVGMKVTGTGIAANTTIATIASSTSITLNNAATASGTVSLTFKVPASRNFDVFAFASGSTVKLGIVLWTDATNRATALNQTTGTAITKDGDRTWRYLATARTTTTDGEIIDWYSPRHLSVWNVYNQCRKDFIVIETVNSYSYTTTTIRQANANTANQFEVVVGLSGLSTIDLHLTHYTSTTTNTATAGLGEDSTTVYAANSIGMTGSAVAGRTPIPVDLNKTVDEGYHYYAWLERGNTGVTFYGDDGGTLLQSGMKGWMMA